jgi:hypothetical protein
MPHRTAVVFAAAIVAVGAGQRGPQQGAPGPWDNDVVVYRADRDGRVERLATFPRAGVVSLARLGDGRLLAAHQHFPEDDAASFDKVAVHFSSDDGRTWTPAAVISVTGLPEGMRFPFDPTLVPLHDGRVRLYFTSVGLRGGPALPAIYSAVSDDGVDYTVEPGRRFGIDGRPVIDCAVVLHNGVFHLYAPDNGTQVPGASTAAASAAGGSLPTDGVGYHATSRDGLSFTREDDVRVDGRRRWLGAAVSDGTTITFFGTGDAGAQGAPRLGPPIGTATTPAAPRPVAPAGQTRGGIWLATSRAGDKWKIGAAPNIPGADPGVAAARDGGWIIAVTGPPRPDTASARGRAGAPVAPGVAGASGRGPDGGPINHRLVLATSKDGMTWSLAAESFAEHASVPALFEGPNGRLIAIYVDASGDSGPGVLGARVERPDGTWARSSTNLRGADPDIVRLQDGSYRAYTKEPDGSILVFLSVDGLRWDRLGTAFRDDRYPNATDPDVFETPDGWVMLLSLGARLLRATSADGLVFTAGAVADLGGSVSSTVKVDGGWRTYFHVNASPQTGGRMVIRSAFTADGRVWRADPGDRVVAPATGPARFGVADPAPVRRADGTWIMLVKSFISDSGR